MPFTVPGIGYAGLGQQTAAAQQVFRQAMGGARTTRSSSSSSRRKRPKTVRRARRIPGKSARRATRGRSNRFTKGSAAAKRHMAKLRKMRRK